MTALARALIGLHLLSTGVHAARIGPTPQRSHALSFAETGSGSATCGDVVPDAQPRDNPEGTITCKCPRNKGLLGDNPSCAAGVRDFDPDKLQDKGCKCAAMSDIFFAFVEDIFAGFTENVQETTKTLQNWHKELQGQAEVKAAELESKWVAIREGVGQNIDKLKADLHEATEEKKAEITGQIKELKTQLDNIRKSLEKYLTESVKKAATSAQEKFQSVTEQLKTAAEGKKAELLEAAEALKARLWELHASVMSNIPSRQSLEVATELLSVHAGELQESKKEFLFNIKKQWEIDSKIAYVREQLELLRAAATNRGAEIGAGAARFTEVISARIGELKEQALTAAAETKESIQDEIQKHEKQLEDFRAAAAEQRAKLRTRLSKSIEGISEDLGALIEKKKDAWLWEIPTIDIQIEKFKDRLSRLRNEAFDKQAELEARLSVVVSSVSTAIGSLQEKLKTAVDEKKAMIQDSIDNLKALLAELKATALDKYDALHDKVSATKVLLTDSVAKLKVRVAEASQDAKADLQAELDKYQELLSRLASMTNFVKEDVQETIDEMLKDLRSALTSAAGSALVETGIEAGSASIQDRITQLEALKERLNDHADSVAADAAAVASEYVGELLESSGVPDRIQRFKSWINELQTASANVFVWTEGLIAEAVETVSKGAGHLTVALEKALTSNGAWWPSLLNTTAREGMQVSTKPEVIEASLTFARDQLSKLRDIATKLKAASEAQLEMVVEMLGKNMGKLQERLATVAVDSREWIMATISNLQSNLGIIQTTAGSMRAALETQLVEVSSTISQQIGEAMGALAAAAETKKAQFQQHVSKLGSLLSSVRAVAAEKGEEATSALAGISDSISQQIGELREKLKKAVDVQKAQMTVRLETLQARLEQVQTAGQGMMGKVQEQVSNVTTIMSTRIGELSERARTAAQDKKEQLQAEIEFLQSRAVTLRSSASAQATESYSHLTSEYNEVVDRLTKKLSALQQQAKGTVQAKIDEVSTHMTQLKSAVAHRRVAIKALLDDLSTNIAKYIDSAKEKAKLMAAGAKETIESRITELQSLLQSLKSAAAMYATEMTVAGQDALIKVAKSFSSKLTSLKGLASSSGETVALFVSELVERIGDWFGKLLSVTNDGGMQDVVGSARASEIIDETVDRLEAQRGSTSLLQDNVQVSVDVEDQQTIDSLHASQAKLWEVVEARSGNPMDDTSPLDDDSGAVPLCPRLGALAAIMTALLLPMV